MGALFVRLGGGIRRLACPASEPLRLDAHAEPAVAGAARWVASIVPFAVSERAPRRYALVVTPAAGLAVGAHPVTEGVREIVDGDHLVFGDGTEAIFSTDALPTVVSTAAAAARCPVCCEVLDGATRHALLSCPRCGAQACNVCWSAFPRGVCATVGCAQPSALDRPLWVPSLRDFVTWEDA